MILHHFYFSAFTATYYIIMLLYICHIKWYNALIDYNSLPHYETLALYAASLHYGITTLTF